MKQRTIMIFPRFENIEVIDQLRDKYDPLAKLVRPHITIVFPFDNEMSNSELDNILDIRLKEVRPFRLEMKGFSKSENTFGNYLFLDVIEGANSINTIHNTFYSNEFKKHDLGIKYVPHITVGKFLDTEELNKAYQKLKTNDISFCTTIDKISVEMIGDDEESIIIIEKNLH